MAFKRRKFAKGAIVRTIDPIAFYTYPGGGKVVFKDEIVYGIVLDFSEPDNSHQIQTIYNISWIYTELLKESSIGEQVENQDVILIPSGDNILRVGKDFITVGRSDYDPKAAPQYRQDRITDAVDAPPISWDVVDSLNKIRAKFEEKKIMGWASRSNEERTMFVVFPNEQIQGEFDDFLKRTKALLITTSEYIAASTELDEDAPDFMDKMGPILLKFTQELIMNYPSPEQLKVDLGTLNQVSVRKK